MAKYKNIRLAEDRGYFKIDFLNVYVYSLIENTEHYQWLLDQPVPWEKLQDAVFVEQIVHLGNHFYNMQKMPEPVDSIERLAIVWPWIEPEYWQGRFAKYPSNQLYVQKMLKDAGW